MREGFLTDPNYDNKNIQIRWRQDDHGNIYKLKRYHYDRLSKIQKCRTQRRTEDKTVVRITMTRTEQNNTIVKA